MIYMDLSDLKPKTRYEWFKLILDIIILIVFVIMIFMNSYSYAEGYKIGYQNCIINMTSPSDTTKINITLPK